MRHAEAGEADLRRWPDDRDRPLTDEGRAEHRLVAQALRRMGVSFDRLLSSPLVRARQTAAITVEVYGGGAPELTEALGDRATPEALFGCLRDLERGQTVLCVGHEPFLPELAALLIAPAGRAHIEVRKSGVLVIDCEGHPAPGGGTLVLHLRPRELIRLAAP